MAHYNVIDGAYDLLEKSMDMLKIATNAYNELM